jgi:hypothetical protein
LSDPTLKYVLARKKSENLKSLHLSLYRKVNIQLLSNRYFIITSQESLSGKITSHPRRIKTQKQYPQKTKTLFLAGLNKIANKTVRKIKIKFI